MIKNKGALIAAALLLCLCRYLYFPFPNNEMPGVRVIFMSFPIRNQDRYIPIGIIESVLFILAMTLLVIGIKKYHIRTILVVLLTYALLPNIIVSMYQETLANGITAISYDGNDEWDFESVREDLLKGECTVALHNHSNQAVAFEIVFLDSFLEEDSVRMKSLMNLAGPYLVTLEANEERSIHVEELLELSDVPHHIEGGTSHQIHLQLIDGETSRTL